MARLPALVSALTAADGRRDRATIDNLARAAREGGLLPETQRGRAATTMTVRHAADLLIAVNVPVPRGDAAAAAAEFRTLRRRASSDRGTEGVRAALGEIRTFGAALELLIEKADALGLEFMAWSDAHHGNLPEPERYTLTLPKLGVEFMSIPAARITLPEFECSYGLDLDRPPGFYGTTLCQSDRVVTVRIGLPTLLRVHDVLFADDEP